MQEFINFGAPMLVGDLFQELDYHVHRQTLTKFYEVDLVKIEKETAREKQLISNGRSNRIKNDQVSVKDLR